MRIGIDARLWSQTGVGRYTQELVENLAEIDKENQYIIFARRSDINSQLPMTNYQLREVNIRWHSLKEQIMMPWILWKEHLDLMHFPYFSVPVFYPGKFIVTIHDLILDHFDTGKASTLPWFIYKIKRMGYKIVMWVTLHRAAKIITVSQVTKQEIMDHYKIKPEKIVVTHEAAGADTVPPLRCEPKPYFLYVGNAYPHKNLERLLEAIDSIKCQVLSIKLILVGPDDYFYKKLKEKVQKMSLTDQVIFHGPATKEELTDLYKNALALVFPSLMEGFGLPGIEAMANGCPVLCSDIPVFHEIYGEAAVYFNPNDKNDIAQKMKDLCYHVSEHDNKLEELREKGFSQVKKYSWQKLAKETLQVYLDSRFRGNDREIL